MWPMPLNYWRIDNEVPAKNEDIDGETEDYHNLVDRIANVLNVINLDTM